MRGVDLRLVDGKYYVRIAGKGGRIRLAPICGTETEIAAVVKKMREAGAEKVWPHVSSHADIHSYRSDYALRLYQMHARPAEELKGKTW